MAGPFNPKPPPVPVPHHGLGKLNKGGYSWTKAKRDALALLKEATPDSVTKLIALTNDADSRVAYMALTQILDRTLGRPSETPQIETEKSTGIVDLSNLTPKRLKEVQAAIATLRGVMATEPEILPPEEG